MKIMDLTKQCQRKLGTKGTHDNESLGNLINVTGQYKVWNGTVEIQAGVELHGSHEY